MWFFDFIFPLLLLFFVPAVKGFIVGSFTGYLFSHLLNNDFPLNEKFFISFLFHIISIGLGYLISDAIVKAFIVPGFEMKIQVVLGLFFISYVFVLLGIKFVTGKVFLIPWDFGFSLLKRFVKFPIWKLP